MRANYDQIRAPILCFIEDYDSRGTRRHYCLNRDGLVESRFERVHCTVDYRVCLLAERNVHILEIRERKRPCLGRRR